MKIPITDSDDIMTEMNGFPASKKVLEISNGFIKMRSGI